MVDPSTVNTVLKKFLTAPRHPGYLDNPKYKHLIERNCEMYMSSAWYQGHWSFDKAKSYYSNMLDDKRRYFCCGLPYQLAIKEGLLDPEQVADEMSEEDFDEISWIIEMCCIFYGSTDGAFYKYDDIEKCRKLKQAFLPLEMYTKRGINIPELTLNEKRIMSVDIALMASKKTKNDASAIIINQAIPNGMSYKSNIVYSETLEGLTTDELGITIMRYFYKYKCTDLVLDCQGNGLGVYDHIIRDQYDTLTGEIYGALSSCNNDEMAERCKVRTSKKVVWCIKATADFNSNAATLLRAGFQNGNINLLQNEIESEDVIKKVSGYKNMSAKEKDDLKLPYIQTSMLINEMINLEHEIINNKVKLKERSGMRKDRWSSLLYNYYITQTLANKLKPDRNDSDLINKIPIRAGKRYRAFGR